MLSSAELMLNTSQRYRRLQSTISSELPLTSFIVFLHRAQAANKVQIGILNSPVEEQLQRRTVPTSCTSWCGKSGCWERRKKQKHGSVLHLYICSASSWVWFTVHRKPHSSSKQFLCSFERLGQAWVSVSVASSRRITFYKNQKNKAEVQTVRWLSHKPPLGGWIQEFCLA